MKYPNGKTPSIKQSVVGRDLAGRPIGGHVLEVHANGEVVVSPPVMTSVLCRIEHLLPLDDVIPENGQEPRPTDKLSPDEKAERPASRRVL